MAQNKQPVISYDAVEIGDVLYQKKGKSDWYYFISEKNNERFDYTFYQINLKENSVLIRQTSDIPANYNKIFKNAQKAPNGILVKILLNAKKVNSKT